MTIKQGMFCGILFAGLTAARADSAPEPKFTPVVPMYTPADQIKLGNVMGNVAKIVYVTLLDPAKMKLVKSGMTLKELVDALGSGYNEYNDGSIEWFFTDTHTLYVRPAKLQEGELLHFLSEKDQTLVDTMDWSGPQETGKGFIYVIVLDQYFYWRVKPLPADTAALVKEGMSLKELVDALGPGYASNLDGVGITHWFFSNGRRLAVWPGSHKKSDHLSFKTGTMQWEPKP
jgi:hypothetical protein